MPRNLESMPRGDAQEGSREERHLNQSDQWWTSMPDGELVQVVIFANNETIKKKLLDFIKSQEIFKGNNPDADRWTYIPAFSATWSKKQCETIYRWIEQQSAGPSVASILRNNNSIQLLSGSV